MIVTTSPIRIANCSGFFGDRPSAAQEMVEQGPIDVLTGDWLAELTMLILSRIRNKSPGGGYARTFVTQMEQVMGTCLDKGIKVVSNAGGLNPRGCAEAVNDIAEKLGLNPSIAYVDGDDLMERIHELHSSEKLFPFLPNTPLGDLDSYLTANAYLGCWGIVEALNQKADIIITGRVTDAAVVCGPAAWHHDWQRDDFDQLAGAVVAGHIIECGAQATGGNYSFFSEIEERNDIGGKARFGFPWADIAEDGSSTIGKHDGTGGLVNTETVTSQILYEIGGPEYLGPDVTARFDTIVIENTAPNRVTVSGVKGQAPPSTLKVAMNELGGYRNSFSVALTGLEIEEKAAFAQATFWDSCPHNPEDFQSIRSEVIRTDKEDADQQEKATAIWKVTVKDKDERKVGRVFTDAMIHTVLASIPGMYSLSSGPTAATPFGIYRPATVPAELVPQYVHILGGKTTMVESSNPQGPPLEIKNDDPLPTPVGPSSTTTIGTVCGTRSGDKGGDANLGVYARNDKAWAWLDNTLTTERLKELLPETQNLTIERYRYPKIRSLNFLIRGLLQEGVAASTRQDSQAKALGEWLRSRQIDIPINVSKETKG
ncbi:MAG: exopolyphosphatase [Acidimicrobiaceae bacterium]|nr:exopolyphosphatase [Acidimicrobiaceae bacterium]